MKFNFSKEWCVRMAQLDDGEECGAGTLARTGGEIIASMLRAAYQEGFQNCRDSEFVGDEAENAAFNQSDTLALCLGFEQGEYEPEPLSAAQGVPEGMVLVDRTKLELANQQAALAEQLIVNYAKAGHTMYGYLDDSCTAAGIAAREITAMLSAAPEQAESKEGKL